MSIMDVDVAAGTFADSNASKSQVHAMSRRSPAEKSPDDRSHFRFSDGHSRSLTRARSDDRRPDAGKVTPLIDKTFPLSEVPEAIRYMRNGHPRDKVVITA